MFQELKFNGSAADCCSTNAALIDEVSPAALIDTVSQFLNFSSCCLTESLNHD